VTVGAEKPQVLETVVVVVSVDVVELERDRLTLPFCETAPGAHPLEQTRGDQSLRKLRASASATLPARL
jgi:hypothetical protein